MSEVPLYPQDDTLGFVGEHVSFGAETSLVSLQGYLAHKKQPPPLRTTIGP